MTMNRPPEPFDRREDERTPSVPADLRAADALLSEALAEWARSDAARTERIHRATVSRIGVPAVSRPVAGSAAGRWAWYVGGGLAAAAVLTLFLRSGGDEAVKAPTVAPLEMVEAPDPVADPAGSYPAERASAAEPVLVALIERDAGRWSEDWTGGDGYGHSAAWAAVVPVLETRDAGFDEMAGEVGAILAGGSH
jgi:hypothetical protein